MPRNARVRPGQMRPTTSLPLSQARAASATAASAPPLGLVGALSSVMVPRSSPDELVVLALGVNLVAGDRPLEIHVKRKSYQDPIVADQLIGWGARKRTRRLPAELLDGFDGLKDFISLTLTDDSGQEVVDQNQTFCPTGSSVRARPDAPPTSPYPDSLSNTPFTLGTVWGLQAGWAIEVRGGGMDGIPLPDGTYTARVRVNSTHCAFFDIPSSQAEVTIGVTVRTMENGEPFPPHDDDHEQEHTRLPAQANAQGRSMLAPVAVVEPDSAAKPAAGASVPAGLRPDLRALPAWGIAVMDPEEPGEEGGQQLAFSANVWNAGPSPLVVDGFRRPGTDLMDAYQYFYDGDGEQVGFVHTGIGDAAFYRFLPRRRPDEVGDLAAGGGVLEALVVRWRPNFDANTANPGESYPVEWVTIEEPNPPNYTVRVQAQSNGAAIFDRTEGIWSAERSLYFDCTTGGEAQLGQLWQYTPRGRSGGVLKLIYESTSIDDLEGPDNLVVVPHTGDVFLQEDVSGEQFVRGVTRRGTIYNFARTALNETEFCGGTFSPDGRTFFLSQQEHRGDVGPEEQAVTYAIWGPFDNSDYSDDDD